MRGVATFESCALIGQSSHSHASTRPLCPGLCKVLTLNRFDETNCIYFEANSSNTSAFTTCLDVIDFCLDPVGCKRRNREQDPWGVEGGSYVTEVSVNVAHFERAPEEYPGQNAHHTQTHTSQPHCCGEY